MSERDDKRCGAPSPLGTVCELPGGHDGHHAGNIPGTPMGGVSWPQSAGSPSISPEEAEIRAEVKVGSGLSALSDEEIEALLEFTSWTGRVDLQSARRAQPIRAKLRAELARRKGGEG